MHFVDSFPWKHSGFQQLVFVSSLAAKDITAPTSLELRKYPGWILSQSMTSISFQIHAAGREIRMRGFKTFIEMQLSDHLSGKWKQGKTALQVLLHFSFVPAWLLTGAMSLVAFPPLNGLCSCNLIKDLTSSPHGYKHNPCTHTHAHTRTPGASLNVFH